MRGSDPWTFYTNSLQTLSNKIPVCSLLSPPTVSLRLKARRLVIAGLNMLIHGINYELPLLMYLAAS